MATYTPSSLPHATHIDELAIKLGLYRLSGEPIESFRKRVLDAAANKPGITLPELSRRLPIQLGLPLREVLKITNSSALKPAVEVTAAAIRLYYDYTNNDVELELYFEDYEWLTDLYAALSGSSYYTVTQLTDYSDYLKSSTLLPSSSVKVVNSYMLQPSRENKLPATWIHECWFSNSSIFAQEESSFSLTEAGQYYIDYTNGIVFSYDVAYGRCGFSYHSDEFVLYSADAKYVALVDKDIDYLIKDEIVDHDTGLPVHEYINPYGANVINSLLKKHSIYWDK